MLGKNVGTHIIQVTSCDAMVETKRNEESLIRFLMFDKQPRNRYLFFNYFYCTGSIRIRPDACCCYLLSLVVYVNSCSINYGSYDKTGY